MTTSRALLALPIIAVVATAHTSAATRNQFLLEYGKDLFAAQQYEDAISHFAELLELDPTDWSANYLTALSYLSLYHPGSTQPNDKEYAEKGIAAFEKTLILIPPSAEELEKAEKYYLTFLDATGEKDKAIAYLEKQLVIRPSDLALINQIAALYQKKGDFTRALEYFEKRASMDSGNKEAWYTLGVNCWARSYHGGAALSQEERFLIVDKGIAAFEEALAIDPDYFDALAYINLAYREKAKALTAVGRDAEAGSAFDTADEYQQRAVEIRKRLTRPQ